MRKRVLAPTAPDPSLEAAGWLDLERVAEVELTSEDAAHPIDSALRPGRGPGWRAAEGGTQLIRLHFDPPQHLHRIRLVFDEHEAARTQEFTLRWSTGGDQPLREVVRQQYNFSPPGTTREVEDYAVDLREVAVLELSIVPDLDGTECRASLAEWRLA